MKIEKVEAFLYDPGVFKNLLFCRIETTDGVYGWGEGFVLRSKERAVLSHIEAVTPIMIGQDPHDIRHLFTSLYDDFHIRRNSLDLLCAWSAIETALWDIVAKDAAQPLYKLLGGKYRDHVRFYANGWTSGARTEREFAAAARDAVRQGFTALKFDPFLAPRRHFISSREEDAAYRNVAAVREAVGDEIDLQIEMGRRLSPQQAVRFIDRIGKFRPALIEEPCLAENIDHLAEVRSRTHLPIQSGETLTTAMQFHELYHKRAVDMINPEVCALGLLNTMDIAAAAIPYAVQFSPHNCNSVLCGLAVSVHLGLMMPNFTIAEDFYGFEPGCERIAKEYLPVRNGCVCAPTASGLGVDIDAEKLLRYGSRELRAAPVVPIWMEYPASEKRI